MPYDSDGNYYDDGSYYSDNDSGYTLPSSYYISDEDWSNFDMPSEDEAGFRDWLIEQGYTPPDNDSGYTPPGGSTPEDGTSGGDTVGGGTNAGGANNPDESGGYTNDSLKAALIGKGFSEEQAAAAAASMVNAGYTTDQIDSILADAGTPSGGILGGLNKLLGTNFTWKDILTGAGGLVGGLAAVKDMNSLINNLQTQQKGTQDTFMRNAASLIPSFALPSENLYSQVTGGKLTNPDGTPLARPAGLQHTVAPWDDPATKANYAVHDVMRNPISTATPKLATGGRVGNLLRYAPRGPLFSRYGQRDSITGGARSYAPPTANIPTLPGWGPSGDYIPPKMNLPYIPPSVGKEMPVYTPPEVGGEMPITLPYIKSSVGLPGAPTMDELLARLQKDRTTLSPPNLGGGKDYSPSGDYIPDGYAIGMDPRKPMATGGRVGGINQIQRDPVAQKYLKGYRGGGQADNIMAMLSPNEYVFDAATVADLGDGNPDEGARRLDTMRENIRTHKRSAPTSSIPPKAKNPVQYMKGKK